MFSFSGWAHDLMDQMMGSGEDAARAFDYSATLGMINEGYGGHPLAYGAGEIAGLFVGALGTDEVAAAVQCIG